MEIERKTGRMRCTEIDRIDYKSGHADDACELSSRNCNNHRGKQALANCYSGRECACSRIFIAVSIFIFTQVRYPPHLSSSFQFAIKYRRHCLTLRASADRINETRRPTSVFISLCSVLFFFPDMFLQKNR